MSEHTRYSRLSGRIISFFVIVTLGIVLVSIGDVHVGVNGADSEDFNYYIQHAFAVPAFHFLPMQSMPEFEYKFGNNGNGEGQLTNSIHVNPTDITSNSTHIFVIQDNDNSISVFHTNGTLAGKIGNMWTGTGPGQFSTPEGIAYNDTHLFVADTFNYRIQIFDSLGEHAVTFNTAQNFRPYGITVSLAHIFVYNINSEKIQIYDLSGNYIKTIGGTGNNNGKFSNIRDIAASYTHLFVVDSYRDDVQIFDTSGKYVGKFGSSGTGDGQFQSPRSIIYASGYLYVTDTDRDDVQIFDISGKYVGKFGSSGTGDGQFQSPISIASNSTHFFVLDDSRSDIQAFLRVGADIDLSPDYVGKFGSGVSEDEEFTDPLRIASNSTHLFVTQNSNNYVQVFHDNGTFSHKIGGYSTSSVHGEFSGPVGVAYNGTHMFIAETNNNRISIFNSTGFVSVFNTTGNNFRPHDIAVTPTHIFAASHNKDMIQVFNATGDYIKNVGRNGQDDGQFTSLRDIAASYTHLFVVDSLRDDVQIFDTSGKYVGKFGSRGTGDGQFQNPLSILYAFGYLYVTDSKRDDVQIFDTSGNYVGKFGSSGTGDGQFKEPISMTTNSTHFFVIDAERDDVQIFSVVDVLPDNTAPVLDSIQDITTSEEVEVRFTVAASDPDSGQTLSYSTNATTSLGASISPSGVFSWTPTESQGPGTYHITITATDNGQPPMSTNQTFSVTVTEANHPPVLDAIGAKSATTDSQLTIQLSANDADVPANTLNYTSNHTAGLIAGSTYTWTPSATDAGTIVVRFTVNDGEGGTDHEDVTITVSDGTNPTITSSATATFTERTAGTHTLVADENGVIFAIVSHNVTGGTSFPTISGGNILSWTPSEQHGGNTYNVSISATDASNNVGTQSLIITVSETNEAPYLTPISARSATVGTPLNITLSATDTDAPINTLTYSTNHTAGSITNNTYTWTPTHADVGTITIKFTVSDGSDSDYKNVIITVITTPDAPTGLTTTVGDGQVALSWSAHGNNGGSPITGYNIEYKMSSATTWTLFAGNPVSSTSATITGLANGQQYQFRASAINTAGTSPVSSVVLATPIASDNTAPAITSSATATFTERTAGIHTLVADENGVTFAIASHNVTGTSFPTISGGNILSWTPSEQHGGNTYSMSISATDASNNVGTQSLIITVSETNEAPYLAPIGSKTASVDAQITIQLSATDADIPSNTFTYSSNHTAGLITGSTYTWTPSATDAGTIVVRFTVNDGAGGTDHEDVTITVSDSTNPTITSPAIATFTERTAGTHTLVADENGVTFAIASHNITGGAPFPTISGGNILSWTPSEQHGGNTYSMSISATDASNNVGTQSLIITVSETNEAPYLAPIGSKTASVDAQITIQLSATDADIPANTFTYSSNHTAGLITGSTYTWTPSATDAGTIVVRFTVNDGAGGTDHEDVTITVPAPLVVKQTLTTQTPQDSPTTPPQDSPTTPPQDSPLQSTFNSPTNTPPTLLHIADQRTNEEIPLIITAIANDTDAGQTLTYSTNATSLGASISSSGVFSWTPTESQGPGTYHITITATDNGSPSPLFANRTFSVTVAEINRPPVLAEIGHRSGIVGTPLIINMSATDPDIPANTLTYKVNATFGTLSNNTFTWTPDVSYTNTTTSMTIMVSDDNGGQDSKQITISVLGNNSNFSSTTLTVVNAPPIANVTLINYTVNEHETVIFTVPVSDPDGDMLTFTLDNSSGSVPRGAIINYTTGVFEWTPGEDDAGTHLFDVMVRDVNGGGVITIPVIITVNEINNYAPVITYPPPNTSFTNVTVGSTLTINVNATDNDGDTLVYSRHSPGTIDPQSGVYVWTPQPSDVGNHDIVFVVSDMGGHTSSRYITVTVIGTSSTTDSPTTKLIALTPSTQIPPKICR